MSPIRLIALLALLVAVVSSSGIRCDLRQPDAGAQVSDTLRIVTYNIEDVRGVDIENPTHRRLLLVADILDSLDADIILLNEIAVEQSANGEPTNRAESNGSRFVRTFLDRPGAPGYAVYQPLSNTGVHSGYDLDNSGRAISRFAEPRRSSLSGNPPAQSDADRAYGNDSWGFGTFPGQYAMALLVKDGLTIAYDDIRTYRSFPWSALPGALRPVRSDGRPWYDDDEWAAMPLSSKTHAVVPIDVRTGRRIHVLISHPTPPAFDGPEERNKKRNHDEIKLLRAIIDDADFLVDDEGRSGGLPHDEPFIVVGDLNADPDEGSTIDNPVKKFLLDDDRIRGDYVPIADSKGIALYSELDPDDTSRFGLRVDYALPSRHFRPIGGGVIRPAPSHAPSDHFPVFVDVVWSDQSGGG